MSAPHRNRPQITLTLSTRTIGLIDRRASELCATRKFFSRSAAVDDLIERGATALAAESRAKARTKPTTKSKTRART